MGDGEYSVLVSIITQGTSLYSEPLPFLSLYFIYWSAVMKDTIEEDSRWGRRESKKKARKTFTSDNRKSVRWLQKKVEDKAREIRKAREKKEKNSWQYN